MTVFDFVKKVFSSAFEGLKTMALPSELFIKPEQRVVPTVIGAGKSFWETVSPPLEVFQQEYVSGDKVGMIREEVERKETVSSLTNAVLIAAGILMLVVVIK